MDESLSIFKMPQCLTHFGLAFFFKQQYANWNAIHNSFFFDFIHNALLQSFTLCEEFQFKTFLMPLSRYLLQLLTLSHANLWVSVISIRAFRLQGSQLEGGVFSYDWQKQKHNFLLRKTQCQLKSTGGSLEIHSACLWSHYGSSSLQYAFNLCQTSPSCFSISI